MSRDMKTVTWVTREIIPPYSSGRDEYHFVVKPIDLLVEVQYLEANEVMRLVRIDPNAASTLADAIRLCGEEILAAEAADA